MSVIHVIEPGPTGGPGAMGCKILCAALKDAGHVVTHVRLSRAPEAAQGQMFSGMEQAVSNLDTLPVPDAWFISSISSRQWIHLARMFASMRVPLWSRDRDSRQPLIVFGGQVAAAPEPIADFADVVALGDGELTGIWLAEQFREGRGKDEIMTLAADVPGFYVPMLYRRHGARPTFRAWRSDAIDGRLTWPGDDDSKTPAIEMARGCRSKCAFCPIGWAGGAYREAPEADVKRTLATLAARGKKAVNLYAPDYSSVSYVADLDRYQRSVGCSNRGLDARLDRAATHLEAGGTVKGFAFGVEGLSERLRAGIGKPLSREIIVSTMARLKGVAVRWYMLLGLPGESDADLAEFQELLAEVAPALTSGLDLTLTLHLPVPHTPFERLSAAWDEAAYNRAVRLEAWLRELNGDKKFRIFTSTPKKAGLHEHDAVLQRGDRDLARYLAVAKESQVSDGRWRKTAESEGVDIAELTREKSWDEPTPWDFVDVGMPRAAKRAAWDAHARRMA